MKKIDKKLSDNRIYSPPTDIFLPFAGVLWIFFITVLFTKYHPFSISNFFLFFQDINNFNFPVFLSNLLNLTLSFILLVGIFFNALWFGTTLIEKLALKISSFYENIAISAILGLGILGYVTFLFGILKLLYAGLFFTLWILFGFLGLRKLESLYKKENILSQFKKIGFLLKICLLLFLGSLIFNFFMCLSPEFFYDTLNYHLGTPNFYKINGKISPMSFKVHSNFPLLSSMIYLYGMMLKDTILPKMINWLFGLLTCLFIFEFCKNKLQNIKAGILSITIFYLTPIVLYRSWTATTDIGLTAFVTSGILSLLHSQKQKKYIFLSAIFCGFAFSTKYTAQKN